MNVSISLKGGRLTVSQPSSPYTAGSGDSRVKTELEFVDIWMDGWMFAIRVGVAVASEIPCSVSTILVSLPSCRESERVASTVIGNQDGGLRWRRRSSSLSLRGRGKVVAHRNRRCILQSIVIKR